MSNLKIDYFQDYKIFSQTAAELVCQQLARKPDSCFVFATGFTPLGLFDRLSAAYRLGKASFQSSFLVELDDYYGIHPSDSKNLFQWLSKAFLDRVDFPIHQTVRFQTDVQDPDRECLRIEDEIQSLGGIDFLVLGLGANGHLGFNEPGSSFQSRTRVVKLTEASLQSSQRYWGEDSKVPGKGFTLGLGTLAEARKTLLLVSGKEKKPVLKKLLTQPPSPDLPASAVHHFDDVRILSDLKIS